MVMTCLARTAGWRKFGVDTRVPSLIRLVLTATALRVATASYQGRSRKVRHEWWSKVQP
jgi:hypothetical protein